VAKHGVDRGYVTEDEYQNTVLIAYHDAICPDRKECDRREAHTAQLVRNYATLKRFLDRLAELELEDAIRAS
jgi:hypothetical protein